MGLFSLFNLQHVRVILKQKAHLLIFITLFEFIMHHVLLVIEWQLPNHVTNDNFLSCIESKPSNCLLFSFKNMMVSYT